MKPAKPQHTPEPWYWDNRWLRGPSTDPLTPFDGLVLWYTTADDGVHCRDADAARIVACVNACAGLDPDALPALIEAAEYLDSAYNGAAKEEGIRRVRAALAAARGTR